MNRFDNRAESWDDNPVRTKMTRQIASAILKTVTLNPEMRVMEYGCGTGQLSRILYPHLKSITMADSSAGMLKVLNDKIKKAKIQNMVTVQLDMTRGEIIADQFDMIYLSMVLHHIQDIELLFSRFHTCLKDEGHLVIADLVTEDGSFHGEDFDGHKGFDQEELTEFLQENGFTVNSYEICYELRKRIADGSVKEFPIFLIVAQKL